MLQNLRNLVLVLVVCAVPVLAQAQGVTPVREQGQALTSLQLIDDIIHAANATLNKAALIACQFDDVSPGTVTENNVSPLRCSNLRELFGIIRDAAGNGRGANVNASNELLVALSSVPTHAVTQSGTWSFRAQDGSGNAITSATRGAERALTVQIVDSSGNQVSTFGGSGGTASNYGSAIPATGTAAGFSDGTNMQAARLFDGDSGAGTQYVLGMSLRKIASGGTVEAGTATDPLRIDPTGTTTQPVSLASVPSHAVTNAGTFVVQENGAALTALQLLDNIVAAIGSTTSGQSGALGMGAVTTAAPTYTTAQTHPLSLTTAGELRVRMESTAVGSTSTDDDGALPSATTGMSEVIGRLYAFNSDSASGVYTRFSHQPLDYDSGAGTENLSVIGIGLPASGGPVIGGTSTNPFNVVFPSSQSVSLSAALPAGTNNIGDVDVVSVPADPFGANADAASATGSISAKLRFIASTGIPITGTVTVASHAVTNAGTFAVQAAQSGTFTVQPGNTANSTPWLVSLVPPTSGGTTPCYVSSAASTNATNCKASAGQLFGYELINTTGTLYYLRLYNLATAPTCSSATGFIRSIPVPAATTGNGITREILAGEAYGTGLGFCLTGGGASTDNTNAATGVYVSLNYK